MGSVSIKARVGRVILDHKYEANSKNLQICLEVCLVGIVCMYVTNKFLCMHNTYGQLSSNEKFFQIYFIFMKIIVVLQNSQAIQPNQIIVIFQLELQINSVIVFFQNKSPLDHF